MMRKNKMIAGCMAAIFLVTISCKNKRAAEKFGSTDISRVIAQMTT